MIGNIWLKMPIYDEFCLNQIKALKDNENFLTLFSSGTIKLTQLQYMANEKIIDYMRECNLIRIENNIATTVFRLSIFEDLIIFSDPDVLDEHQDEYYVDPLWDKYLCKVIVRNPCLNALDMGGGSGIISLVMSRFSKRVVYADLNPRAIEMAKFNAAINSINNIEFYLSNLFENIPKIKYDLIVFNSPTDKEGNKYLRLLETGEQILINFYKNVFTYLNKNGIVQTSMGIFDTNKNSFEKISCWIGEKESIRYKKLYLIMKEELLFEKKTWRRMWVTICNSFGSSRSFKMEYNLLPDQLDGKVSSDFISNLLYL